MLAVQTTVVRAAAVASFTMRSLCGRRFFLPQTAAVASFTMRGLPRAGTPDMQFARILTKKSHFPIAGHIAVIASLT